MRLVTGAVEMGHLELAKHWLEKKSDVLGSLEAPECQEELERCSREIARMETIEAIHGAGSALNLTDRSVVELIKYSLIPSEIILRARRAQQDSLH